MYDAQLIGGLILIGIFIYSTMIHGTVYYRLRDHRVHGVFALLCFLFAAYATTNIVALYFATDIKVYVSISKLSSVFVIFAVVAMPWFASEYLQDKVNIPVKIIVIVLIPFFVLNLVMENGILWSRIDVIELSPRSWGSKVMQPVNAVISWPMYGLWAVIAGVYIVLVRAAYLSLRHTHRKRGLFLFAAIVMLTAGFAFDMLIDMGINNSYFYVSEYVVLAFVLLMSLHLSDELRINALNLEALVSERTNALQEVNKELESFSYSVSHDLRAPLRAIHGFASLLKQDYAQSLDGEAHDLILRITNNVNRMQAMIDGLLKLARISRDEMVKSEIDLSSLASEIVDELREKEPGRQVAVTIEEGMSCYCDATLVRILLENLLGNAWKYTRDADTPTITINRYVSAAGQNGFSISDNGAGFNSEYKDKLFMPFQRLHSVDEFPGIGIGLATAARIVKRHGGAIWAESKKNHGATFFFVLG